MRHHASRPLRKLKIAYSKRTQKLNRTLHKNFDIIINIGGDTASSKFDLETLLWTESKCQIGVECSTSSLNCDKNLIVHDTSPNEKF